MLTLIHGDDTQASRNYYFDIKQKSKESIVLDGLSISPTDLQQVLSGSDLFGQSKTVFIENLLSKRKTSQELDSIVSLIQASGIQKSSGPKDHQPLAEIILWESKELTKKQSQQFGNIIIKEFKIPSTIFALLDGLKPDNGKELIELFHKTLQDKDPEFVLVMLQRQVRILLALSSRHSEQSEESQSTNRHPELNPESRQISEVSRLAPWQRGKMEKQAKLFTANQLVTLHDKLFQLELGMKTGGLTLPLADSIDFLLLSI